MVLNFCSEESCPKVKIQKFWKNQAEQISEISLVSTWAFGRPVNGVLRRCFRQAIKERQAEGHMYKSPWLCSPCYMERAQRLYKVHTYRKGIDRKRLTWSLCLSFVDDWMTGDCLEIEFPDFKLPNSLQHCRWDMFLSRFFVFLFGVYYHPSSSQWNLKAKWMSLFPVANCRGNLRGQPKLLIDTLWHCRVI